MRVIEEKMLKAISKSENFSLDNTSCKMIDSVSMGIYLHGNEIAIVNTSTGLVMVNRDTLKRWPTNTTKSRLRALGVPVGTKKGIVYIGDQAI